MRTQLSTYEKSFWDKQANLLARTFPRLNDIVGISRITNWLPEYLTKYPCEKNNTHELGRYFPKFLRQQESLRDQPHLPELARFEWAELMASTKIQLMSSLYPVHLKQEKEFKLKRKALHFYALQLSKGKVQIHILTDFEYRILHWLEPDTDVTRLLKKSALLGYNENQVYAIVESLNKRSLTEHKLRYQNQS